MKPEGSYDITYKGSEYMSIYPYITYSDGTERFQDGRPITKGYYVVEPDADKNWYTPLLYWFSNRKD